MTSFEIKVGTACNNNCIFCLNEDRKINLTTENIKQKILQAKKNGVDKIHFTGGEPTLRNDFLDLLKYCKLLGLKTLIQTNGRALSYYNYAEKLCSTGIESILISLHACDPELNFNITKTSDSFKQTILGIKNLVRLKQNFSINVVVNKLNTKNIKKIVLHHTDLSPNLIQLSWCRIKGKAKKNVKEIVPKYTENIKEVTSTIDAANKKNIPIKILNVPQCILGKYSEYAADPYEDRIDFDNDRPIFYKNKFKLNGKEYCSTCKECDKKNECDGILKGYVDAFGEKEFKPIKKGENIN